MSTFTIRDIPISFPFKPYDIQKDYMEKVIECLQTQTNGVLESPTGTGKTLSLLCSSLAWLTMHKAKCQADGRMGINIFNPSSSSSSTESTTEPGVMNLRWDTPTIIYASRTHSQLTQAMQELKRTAYSHVRSTVIGSRDQLCVHPDVVQQLGNANKTHMCQSLVKNRNCIFHTRVERMAMDQSVTNLNIADIEDLVSLGTKHKFCPFYMARELRQTADIIFLPYNYLLDPKARRANQIDLRNSVIILDEAHNVERVCEDCASFQLKTTDIALCIDELTQVMKHLDQVVDFMSNENEKDFSADDVALFKQMLLNLEAAIDDIPLKQTDSDGVTFEGKFIFELLAKAGITTVSQGKILALLSSLTKFMTTNKENPFMRSGTGLQILEDALMLVFQNTNDEYKDKVNQCFKVHLAYEPVDRKKTTTASTWLSKATSKDKTVGRVLSYWCFSPSFGMKMLLEQGVRCIILTSGTLAPLKPLISELGINISVRLENPHVIDNKQICVKILSSGPDGVALNAGFQNRDNPKYISSLGMTIVNISRQVPNGLLVFFPSYALLSKCQESWQQTGIWNTMNDLKQIFIEPRTKDTFSKVMHDFYDRVKDPQYKGATFMAVCRGKVSEGLDFADINGRAVIVTGLPYPPYKDPRVVLKRKYLDVCRARNAEYISGQEWYGLEATRAVNQAIGRVIRHQHDYGAIFLLDHRFNYSTVKCQLSLWIRGHVKLAQNFGELIRDMRVFFNNAKQFDALREQQKATDDFGSVKIHELVKGKSNKLTEASTSTSTSKTVLVFSSSDDDDDHHAKNKNKDKDKENINSNKRNRNTTKFENLRKKMKLHTVDYTSEDIVEFLEKMKKNLDKTSFDLFQEGIKAYSTSSDLNVFIDYLDKIFCDKPDLRDLIKSMKPYIKDFQQEQFAEYLNTIPIRFAKLNCSK